MNKKLLFLLPAALLALTGCNPGGNASSGSESASESGSGSGSGSSSSESVDYGTADDPLSVAEAIAVYDAECGTAGTATQQRVYVQGVVTRRPRVMDWGWYDIYVADSLSGEELWVYSANKANEVETVSQNDTIIAEGFIKNHYGTREMTATEGSGAEANSPTLVARTAGSSSITASPDEHSSVTGLTPSTASAANDTVVTFSAAANEGYNILSVKAYGSALEESEEVAGQYSFVLAGDVTIEVETIEAGKEELVAYKLDGTITGGDSGYAAESAITQEGLDWGVVGNTTMSPWRIGGKGAFERTVKSKAAVSAQKIHKVEVEIGGITVSAFDSLTLNVGTEEGGSTISSIAKTTGLNANTTLTFNADTADWTSRYFTLVFAGTAGTSSNQYIHLIAVTFYYMG